MIGARGADGIGGREDAGAGKSSARSRAVFTPTNLLLAALGCASLFLYRRGVLLSAGKESISEFLNITFVLCALYAAGALVVWRARPRRSTLATVVVFAALFRLVALVEPPRLSDDIYRYIWDGRVQSTGTNPYRYIPADPHLASLRDAAIYEHVNRRDYAPTIYPPVAQLVFLAATRVSESVVWMKIVMVAFEAAGLWAAASLLASFGLPRQRVLLAAWHPLLVWEIASSGHLDALMICFVCLALLARRHARDASTGLLLACAALTKFFPVALAPALYRRWGWRLPAAFVALCVAAYSPYLSVGPRRALGFLGGYAAEEGLQSGARFFVLNLARRLTGFEIPLAAYAAFTLAVLGALAAWALFRRETSPRDFVGRAFAIAAAFTALLSPHYTWYFAWLVPFLCLARPAWVVPGAYLTAASFLLYRSWLGDSADEMFVIHSLIYLPSAALCAGALLLARLTKNAKLGAAAVVNEPTGGD